MLSLCIIAKNEEAFIGECLSSVQGLADDIVVVDTGSTDRTKEIASEHKARIFFFPWKGDFSAARNEALKHARGEWILVLDADECLNPQEHEKVKQCMADPKAWGFRVPIFNYSAEFSLPGWSSAKDLSMAKQFPGFILTRVVRLFRNKPEIRYRFSVHEGVEFAIEEQKGILTSAPFIIHHYGALRGKENSIFKQDTYFAFVKKDCEQYHTHPKPFYELGTGLLDLGKLKEAKEAFEQALHNNEHYLIPYHQLGVIALKKGEVIEAKHLFEKSLSIQPGCEETYFLLGEVELKLHDPDSARKCWGKALEKNPRSILYFDALIQFHLARKEPLQALALLYDAVANTGHVHFRQQLKDVETQLISAAKHILASGPEKTSLIALITIAFYRREMKKVIALSEEAKKHFISAEGHVFDVLIEKAKAAIGHTTV